MTKKLTPEEKEAKKQARAKKTENKDETVVKPESIKNPEEIALGIEAAPENIFEPEEKQSRVDSILMGLGFKKDPKAPPVKPPTSAKLNAAQSQVCDMATPIVGSLLVISLGWLWSQVDEDYRALAPSNEAAESIVAPLVRIYARSNKALVKSMSPNTVDALLCLNGVIMYMHASFTMLHEINALKREQHDPNQPRDIRSSSRPTEARTDSASTGRVDIPRANNVSTESHATGSSSEPPSNLNERERQNFESLDILRERDIAARARRSGRL